ncbi:MAG TPA: DUF1622 domain-containing protein [Candidatus Binataceae bacterium]|nr:DUF1622 domain-containing protein [Candidatus Binataceae bacterium]
MRGVGGVLGLVIEIATKGIEVLAVVIIIAGVAIGTVRFLLRGASEQTYEEYKQILDKALLLGLNILVAADIVRTVALDPTIANIIGLGLLVVVRTFLSWALFVELNERWPWEPERVALRDNP